MKESNPYARVLQSYARQAPYYDRLWRRYNNATLRATLEMVPWSEVKCVLNAGCGTALLEQEVERMQLPLRVVGLDLSREMLRQARQKRLPPGRFCWVNAAAEVTPFRSGVFDAVLCANCFHYFRRPLESLKEFRRLLRPGGALVLTDWCDDYLACKICDRLLRLLGGAHVRTYSSKECERLLLAAGFQIQAARKFKIDWLWGLMTFRARA